MSRITRRRWLGGAAGFAAALPFVSRANAADWRPTETVKIMVPAPAAGLTDVMGRLVAQHLQAAWGQSVIVDNKGGASGTIGALEFARSKPDGHSLMIGNPGPNAIALSVFKNVTFKEADFLPTASLIRVPNIISCNPAVPIKSVSELISYLKANPDKFSYGSSGVGQTPHLTLAWFMQMTGVKMTHVPFRGAAPALAAALGGQVELLTDNLFPTLPQVQAGKLRALAVTSSQRVALAPGVPTVKESAPELKDFEVTSWFGVFLPAGANPAVVSALNQEIGKLLATGDFRKRMADIGATPTQQTPAEFGSFVRTEAEKFAEIVRKEGIQLEAN
jgi:tripartite-type tricarboxylate transporter receptor subunit TctC